MLEKNLSLKETFDLAVQNHKEKNYKVAEYLYSKLLISKPNHIQTLMFIGTLCAETKNYESAIKYFEKVIKFRPQNALAYNNIGMIHGELGNFTTAITCFKNAITINPNLNDTRNNLCILLRSLTPNQLNEKEVRDLKELFLILYKRNDIDHDDIFRNAKNILFRNKNYEEILKSETVSPLLENINIKSLLNEDLFQLMMQKSLIADSSIEELLIKIRKEILKKIYDDNVEDINAYSNFLLSLSEQCFFNEFMYFQTEEEIKQIKKIRSDVENNKKISEINIAILGSYISLASSQKLEERVLSFKSSNTLFNDLIKIQIYNSKKEQDLKKTIKTNKVVEDEVSQKVRKQYEENPYPRWRYIYKNNKINFLIRLQNQIKPNAINIKLSEKFDNPQVLVAGCGTGRHISIVDSYKNANILAVDLSLSSLAYAKRKAEENNLKNVNFLQSDILNLKNLKKKFDIIESVGVIHHMKDPLKGLKVLLDLLEPHGFLKLGLYSKIARQHINRARDFIKKNNLKTSVEDIRRCRKMIMSEKNDNLLKRVSIGRDFYSTSSVRDLIFHEQEYCFTIPEISQLLSKFKLNFLGFSDPIINSKYYKVYNEDKNNLLENWDKFEKNNPKIFNGMYNFWVKK